MGRIAQAVAQRLRAFGTHGIFFDPLVDAVEGLQRGSFAAGAAAADVVTLHVPLTAETRHMISAAELAQMKRGAYLINTSRGGLIDESALVQALEQGHLAAAALDVFETEPMPSRASAITPEQRRADAAHCGRYAGRVAHKDAVVVRKRSTVLSRRAIAESSLLVREQCRS